MGKKFEDWFFAGILVHDISFFQVWLRVMVVMVGILLIFAAIGGLFAFVVWMIGTTGPIVVFLTFALLLSFPITWLFWKHG